MTEQRQNIHNFTADETIIVVKVQASKLEDLERFAEYIKQIPDFKIIHVSRIKVSPETQQYFCFSNFVRDGP